MRLVPGRPVRLARAAQVGGALVLTSLCAVAAPASAHTSLEYSVPADREQVEDPVTQITVAFADPVTLVGAGFEVFTPQEEIVEPNVFTEDGMVFLLQLDEPLAGGEAGVRYEITAADGHVLEGGFRFTVTADVGDTTAPAVDTASSTVPVSAISASVAPSEDGGGGSSTGIVVGVAAAVLAAAAFLALRARSARRT